MKTRITCFTVLLFFPILLYCQTDTLKCKAEYIFPFNVQSMINLACDSTNFWISNYDSKKIYKLDAFGTCIDSINTYKTTCVESEGDNLWIIHDFTDWLCKLNKNTGEMLDSIKMEMPSVFTGGYQSRDICYLDSSLYSIWSYTWNGKVRLLKADLRTRLTIDLGDIPFDDYMVVINDTIWTGSRYGFGFYPVYSNNSIINTYNRSIYLGDFYISGATHRRNSLWAIDYDNIKLKEFTYPSLISNGVEPYIFENNFTIYPNPSSDYITINIENSEYDNCLMEVFDIYGKKIISKKQKTKTYKLDLTGVKSGIYILKLSDRQTEYKSVKLIKN